MATAGVGLKTIAMALNADGVRSPRAGEGRHRSWAPSSIRTVLFNVLYTGRRPLGTHQETGRLGPSQATGRPASEWVVTKLDRLRIVSDELWASAHDSLRTRQKSFGLKQALPRLAGSRDSKYLLSGFVRCGVCGGSIVQSCQALKYVLDPQEVEAALVFALDQLTRADTGSAARREDLRTELARIEPEPSRYADAIADAGPLDTILQAIKVREERRDDPAGAESLRAAATGRAGREGDQGNAPGLSGRVAGDD